ncbi:hypothetical protein niasHT_026334 [Heterodera trifolii]|uniref:Secreted protein n=1 Tax=Heterodera trifolii TaxID=157864 RepID=A0ABD2K0E4_9BILA
MFLRLFCITSFCYLLLLLELCDTAKLCYSGRNKIYSSKQCSSGSFDINYVCQKYTCEGGRSSFTLRTCAMKSTGCIAGTRTCRFSGGKGSCQRCEGDLCNL